MASTSQVIALLTDFGTRDPYVGVMKGVALGLAPRAALVDLTHEVPPQDVAAARRTLAQSFGYFPQGTVFVAVVDPGVGTARRALAARAAGRYFLAPDNGLLGFLADAEFRVIDADRWGLRPQSATFHGRDVFAPAAGRLAAGLPFARLGPRVAAIEPGPPEARARRVANTLRGEVVAVDRFGNLITNVGAAELDALGPRAALRVEVAGRAVGPVRETYADVPRSRLLCLVGSAQVLETAVRDGDAARRLRAGRGAPVVVRPTPPRKGSPRS